ncbi:hypothetical protein GNY06_04300 [Elizabethkingia argentiflava]|uniref:Uncharacterized protein n=1 Tax=Elizabethkingia argenteiflava TaxID=2681556 RepID=A0A845PQR7_9FLAO|nr:hypothetical protein [Elizabethkingia argenteiflava]NAW50639.1 hypothetical protein [Elizabethkingia argenteiflava]
MNVERIIFHINAYKAHGQILDAANFVVREWELDSRYFAGFGYRQECETTSILLTTEGDFGSPQKIKIPVNLFDFDLGLVINLIAHEMMHVEQRAAQKFVEDKNEREWQAYYEMLFHKRFPKIWDLSNFYKKFFIEKALVYYGRMREGSELQHKYAGQKAEMEAYKKILTEQKN